LLLLTFTIKTEYYQFIFFYMFSCCDNKICFQFAI
jgi:hypothetical protein